MKTENLFPFEQNSEIFNIYFVCIPVLNIFYVSIYFYFYKNV